MSKTGDAPAGKLLKYTAYLFRNPQLSETEFHDHWRHHHARYPLAAFQKHGVVRYTQYHSTEATRRLLEPMVAARQNHASSSSSSPALKFQIVPYDAIVQIWFRDIQSWEAVGKEPVFGEAIFQDEAYLFDCSRSYVTLGWEEDMFVDGEIVMPGDHHHHPGLAKCLCQCKLCISTCQTE